MSKKPTIHRLTWLINNIIKNNGVIKEISEDGCIIKYWSERNGGNMWQHTWKGEYYEFDSANNPTGILPEMTKKF